MAGRSPAARGRDRPFGGVRRPGLPTCSRGRRYPDQLRRVRNLAPGGGVLVDLKLAIGAGNLVHLRRRDDGVLEGRFDGRWASFMAMRQHGDRPGPAPGAEPARAERTRLTDVPVPPWRTPVLWFLAQLCGLPRDVGFGAVLDPGSREPCAARLTGADGSWACAGLSDGVVAEAGNTSLWEPVERAHRLWLETGRPGWERFGLTTPARRTPPPVAEIVSTALE